MDKDNIQEGKITVATIAFLTIIVCALFALTAISVYVNLAYHAAINGCATGCTLIRLIDIIKNFKNQNK